MIRPRCHHAAGRHGIPASGRLRVLRVLRLVLLAVAVQLATSLGVLPGRAAAQTATTIRIVAPPGGTVFALGAPIVLRAVASDADGADLGDAVAWDSSLDGSLGGGASLETVLSLGLHTVRATVTDAAGTTASDAITIGVVIPAAQGDTAPLVEITAPAPTGTIAAGPPVTFAGAATDLEDGVLSQALVWTSDRDGALGTGATFTRALSQGIHRITARVTDAGGASGSATIVVQVGPPVTLAFTPVDDASVDAAQPTENFGTSPTLRVDANTARQTYLRFAVSGVGDRAVTHALLRLQADAGEGAGSESAGSVHAIVAGPWDERTVTWNTRPTIDPTPLATDGAVVRGEVIDFDVSSAIAGDGTYELALVTDSPDEVTYRSKEGDPAPRLILTLSGTPPVVTIAAPAPGTVVHVGDPVALQGQAEDLQDGNLDAHIEWISSRDGLVGGGPAVVASTLSVGTHTISATAMDAQGAVGSAEVQVIVLPALDHGPPPTTVPANSAPALAITTPATGGQVLMHHPVVLNATAVDAEDGDLGAAVRWVSSRDGVLGRGATVVVPQLSEGMHVITASVADQAGVPAAASITLTVVPETRTLAAVADTYVDAGSPTTAFGAAPVLLAGITPASRQAFVRFTVAGLGRFTVQRAVLRMTADVGGASGGTIIPTSDASWNEATVTYATRPTIDGRALRSQGAVAAGQAVDVDVTRVIAGDGDYGFALVSTAGDGVRYRSRESGDAPQLILVLSQANPPVVTIRSPVANAGVDGEAPVSFVASAIDGNGADVSAAVRWSSSLDGALGGGAAITVPRLTPGTHVVTATVTDAQGMTAEARVALLVRRPNAAPSVTILSPVAGVELRPGVPVRLAALVSDDTDRDIASRLSWTSSRDGALGTGPSLSTTLTSGHHTITAQVTDSGGRTVVAQVDVPVSFPPTVAISAPADGASALPLSTVSLAASAFDADEGDLSRAIAWSSDLAGPLGTGAVVRTSVLAAGRHTITATVTDRTGLSAVASRVLVVNTPPTVAITAPLPYWRFVPGEPLTLAATATDAEDGSLATRIVWSSDVDGPLGTGPAMTVPTLSPTAQTLTATVADAAGAIVHASIPVQPFGCLAQAGPVIPFSGTFLSGYVNYALALATKLDARAGTFLGSTANRYPLNLRGDTNVCVAGGTVLGQYDRTLSWNAMHGDNNNAAVAFDNAGLTVEGFRIDDVTDGVRPQAGDGFVVRGTRMSYVRDDCIENDHMLAGTLDDSLLDGCYVAFSSRPSQAIIDSGFDGHAKVWTISNTLVRLQPMPQPDGTTADGLGHGGFFKWHNWDNPSASLSPKLVLRDNVFMAERAGVVSPDRMGVPPGQVLDCANNVMVWLGQGPYPATLPSCFTVTTDRGVWDRAVAAWESRHPQVAR